MFLVIKLRNKNAVRIFDIQKDTKKVLVHGQKDSNYLGLQLPCLLTAKTGVNYLLPRVDLVITVPIGKNSVYLLGFLKVKVDFKWSSLDSPVTHASNFKNYQKKLPPQKITIHCVQHNKLW